MTFSRRAVFLWAFAALTIPLRSQDLTPRAYVISPTGSSAVIVSSSFNSGHVLVDPTVPVENAQGTFQVPVLGYYQSFDLFGRSANVTAVVPYVHGDFSGTVNGAALQSSPSGLADSRVRLAVNLHGGPAMNLGDYLNWKEKRLIGASLTVTIPSGQYDPARLINTSTNRWGFKPEIGMTRRWRHWVADWYMGVWFFTGNNSFYPGYSSRTQKPLGAVEGHWGYYFKPRLWISADANFWAGSRTSVNGVPKQDEQRDSRIGATASIPIGMQQSLKFSYSRGAYVTIGGAYTTVSVGWQYSWIRSTR